jgi:hypothetical protein
MTPAAWIAHALTQDFAPLFLTRSPTGEAVSAPLRMRCRVSHRRSPVGAHTQANRARRSLEARIADRSPVARA